MNSEKMKDKENQIEEMLEMARIIAFDLCPSGKQHNRLYREPLCYSNDNFSECSKIKNVVDNLYEQGYRKLPEDSVVLSRKEYEKLKSLYDNQKGAYMTSNIGDLPLTVEGLRKAVDEITRLNRVETELQELKDRIAELEKEIEENAFYAKGYAQGIKNTYEVVIPEKLKQFAKGLKDKAIRRQEFIGELAIDDIEYVKTQDIDETLKEFIND